MGKGSADPHSRFSHVAWTRGTPIIEFDFCFFKSAADEGDDAGVSLVALDCETGMMRATALASKSVDKYTIEFLTGFIKSVFVGRVCLRSDNEASAVALAEAVKQRMPEQVTTETTPRYSSGSLGSVERAHREVQGQARSLRYHVLAEYGESLDPGSP
eukprot:1924125-Amphidinium_carterae.1